MSEERLQRGRVEQELETLRVERQGLEDALAAAQEEHATVSRAKSMHRGRVEGELEAEREGRQQIEDELAAAREEHEAAKAKLQAEAGAALVKVQAELQAAQASHGEALHMEQLQIDATHLLYELRSAARSMKVA